MLVSLVTLLLATSAKAFRLTSQLPGNASVAVDLGGSFELRCRASADIRSCVWQHRQKTCRFDYDRGAGRLVKTRCRVYEHQVFSVGEYKEDECAILVREVTQYDAGLWKCHVREYITRWFIWANPATVTASFRVQVSTPDREESTEGINEETEIGNRILLEGNDGDGQLNEVPTITEEQEHKIALIVLGSLFGVLLVAILSAGVLGLLWQRGLIFKRESSSIRLRPVNEERNSFNSSRRQSSRPQSAWKLDGEVQATNDKALAKLGVIKYSRSRRVL